MRGISMEMRRISTRMRRISLEMGRISTRMHGISMEMKRISTQMRRISMQMGRISIQMRAISMEMSCISGPAGVPSQRVQRARRITPSCSRGNAPGSGGAPSWERAFPPG